jgi:hypothetical protein
MEVAKPEGFATYEREVKSIIPEHIKNNRHLSKYQDLDGNCWKRLEHPDDLPASNFKGLITVPAHFAPCGKCSYCQSKPFDQRQSCPSKVTIPDQYYDLPGGIIKIQPVFYGEWQFEPKETKANKGLLNSRTLRASQLTKESAEDNRTEEQIRADAIELLKSMGISPDQLAGL